MIYTVSKRMEISAAHKLNLDYDSPCQNLHGHNWIIIVSVCGTKKNKNGMLIDFKQVKNLIHDELDHAYINDVIEDNPTAENIGTWTMNTINTYLEQYGLDDCCCYKVDVQESEGNTATVYADYAPIYRVSSDRF